MIGVVFYAIATTCCLGVVVWNMGGVYRRIRRLEEQVRLLQFRLDESSSDWSNADKEALRSIVEAGKRISTLSADFASLESQQRSSTPVLESQLDQRA